MTLQFTVRGIPKAQPRPKATIRKGAEHASVYDPGTADGWKLCIRAAYYELKAKRIEGPVRLILDFCFSRPKSHYGSGKNAGKLKPGVSNWVTTKPDLDNLEKAVKDALTDAGAWRDDAQVCHVEKRKIYAHHNQPACIITIMEVE